MGSYKCQLSVKILAICQLSVNWLLIIKYASQLFLFDPNWLKKSRKVTSYELKTNNLALSFSIFGLTSLHHAIVKLVSSWTTSTVSKRYKCRPKWTRIDRPDLRKLLQVEVKCPPPQYQRCCLMNRYHTHLPVRGVAKCFECTFSRH